MDLYLEFRKMVHPLVIEDANGERGEDLQSMNIPDENEEIEEEQSTLAFAR